MNRRACCSDWRCAVVLAGSLALAGRAAAAWSLSSDATRWDIDARTGAILAAETSDGLAALRACADRYAVVYAKETRPGDETGDAVVKANTAGLPAKLVLTCRNEALGLDVSKTYRADPYTGWLHKETSVAAPKLDKAFLHFVSHVQLTGSLWNGGILYHPAWHTGHHPIFPTANVEEQARFTVADGTGLMCLTSPRRSLTVGHVRWRSNGKPVFWDYIATFGGGLIKDPGTGNLVRYEVPGVDAGTVARPTGWHMSAMHGPIGNGRTRPIAVEVAYAVAPGDFLDFQLAYVEQPDIHDLLHFEAATMPRWINDVIITCWEDYQVTPENNDQLEGQAWGKLLNKMWFGQVVNVNFGFYEGTYEYPVNDKEWETAFSTMPAKHAEHIGYTGLTREECVVREYPPNVVMRSRWKPSHHKASNEAVLAAAGNPDRLKICPYTHIGHTGFDREMLIVKEHPEIILKNIHGEPYRHAMDYNMDWNNPVGMRVQGANPLVQDFWVRKIDGQFAYMDLDVTYIDGVPRNSVAVDWERHTATQNEDVYPMYARFIDMCRKHNGGMFMNYPVPLYCDMGYSEYGWFSVYKMDWRAFSGRQSGQQVYARRGQPVTLVGHFESMHGEPMQSPSAAPRLHAMLTLNLRLGMNNFGALQPMHRLKFYCQAMPWLQAAYELRMRRFVNPHVTPRWWAGETELEAHGYNLDRSSGVVVFMNHEPEPLEQEVTFETAPLGLKKGRPAWVWRIQLPHPRSVDYGGVTETSPIRRLARQTLVATHDKLPATITHQEAWPPDVPVILLVTQTPALVESVDGKSCQLWLPKAYDAGLAGVRPGAFGRADLRLKNRHDAVSVLVPAAAGSTPGIQMRRLDAMHEAGVLPAFEGLAGEAVERDGARFIRFTVPRGTQELVIQ